MDERFSRTARMLGEASMQKLNNSRVAVFGLGGVGGYVVEALARSGVGNIDVIDNDVVNVSNINRQIIATEATVGRSKVDVVEERILSINPYVKVCKKNVFFLPETASSFDFSLYDYVVDAIDTVTGKIELVLRCNETATPIISCMGTGNKLCPDMLEVADIYDTSVCPLARVMRRELKSRGIKKLKVVYSKEQPMEFDDGQRTPASNAFVPPTAGLLIASEVIKQLIKQVDND